MSESQSPLVVNIDEFSEPERLEAVFCSQMTEEEYEEQTATETQRALKDLMAYIEVNPDSYLNVVQRRKTEHLEEAGMMSFLKVKMLSMLNGGVYPGTALTEEQKTKCVSHLKVGMQRAFDYSQEAKGRRVSKRLMEKHAAALRAGRDENAAVPVAHIVPRTSGGTPPPPPPPPPPAELTPCRTPLANLRRPPLRDRNSQPSTPFPNSLPRPKSHVSRALGASESRGSTTSLASLTHELNSSNPMKRLRATAGPKSPGGTPSRSRKHRRGGSATSLHSTPSEEPLHLALMNILEQKFRNVRSPSPAGRFNNAMSPASASQNSFNQTGFTP